MIVLLSFCTFYDKYQSCGKCVTKSHKYRGVYHHRFKTYKYNYITFLQWSTFIPVYNILILSLQKSH